MQDWLCVFGKADPTTGVCAITSSQQSLVVSILSAGTFFGALFAAPTADFLGRRWSVVLAVIIFCAGVAMQTAATALPLFVVGRVFAGLGVGMVSMLIPMYQSECSPKWIRSVFLHSALSRLSSITDPRDHPTAVPSSPVTNGRSLLASSSPPSSTTPPRIGPITPHGGSPSLSSSFGVSFSLSA